MTKERLKDYVHLCHKARKQREALVTFEASLYSARSNNFSSVPRGPGGYGRGLEAKVSRHLQLCEDYDGTLFELESEQLEIEQALDRVPYPERLVLRARYLSGMSWENVCKSLGYEWAQAHRLHNSALLYICGAKVAGSETTTEGGTEEP